MALSNAAKAGVAFFLGTVQFGIFMIVAEAVYPGYSVAANYISDLGATCVTGQPCVIPPSSAIFNVSVALLGLLILVGAVFIHRAFHWRPATLLVALGGIGPLGVGLFPETTGLWHDLFSLIAFLFAGLSAIVLARFQTKPMFYFSIILGLATLLALVGYIGGNTLGLGVGGMERMVVYPVLLWGVGFGGYLMAAQSGS